MIRYDKLNIEIQSNVLRLVKEFKEKREKIKLNHMNIIFQTQSSNSSYIS